MSIFKGVKQVFGFEDAEVEEKLEEEEIIVEIEEKEIEEEKLSVPTSTGGNNSKNVYNNSDNISDYQTIFVAPVNFEECKKIANYIKKDKIVTINLEGVTNEDAQRLLDFLSGAMEVKNARFIAVSKKVYVSIPNGINSYVEEEGNEIFG